MSESSRQWCATLTDDYQRRKISQSEYDQFEYVCCIYILKGLRYGEAFCEHFKLGNATPLYHFNDQQISRRWIADNYLEK